MTDAEFARQVEADAVAAGWPRDVAQFLARVAGKPTARPPRSTARSGPVGRAPKALDAERQIAALVKLLRLPPGMAAEFREAGIGSVERVREMLRPLIDPRAFRNAAAALRLRLFAMAQQRKKATP